MIDYFSELLLLSSAPEVCVFSFVLVWDKSVRLLLREGNGYVLILPHNHHLLTKQRLFRSLTFLSTATDSAIASARSCLKAPAMIIFHQLDARKGKIMKATRKIAAKRLRLKINCFCCFGIRHTVLSCSHFPMPQLSSSFFILSHRLAPLALDCPFYYTNI